MGACSSCLGLGRRDRGVEVAYSLLDATKVLTCLPCALRIPKHLVYCTMILTAHNTEQLARLSTERSINQTRNQFDGREKRWRVSVTTCLSMFILVIPSLTIPDMQTSDILDVFTSLPQSSHSNSNLNSPSATSTDKGMQMARLYEENTTVKREPAPQDMKYRTVRAAPSAGRIWRDLSGDPKKWEEAKAVMEGSGERG